MWGRYTQIGSAECKCSDLSFELGQIDDVNKGAFSMVGPNRPTLIPYGDPWSECKPDFQKSTIVPRWEPWTLMISKTLKYNM